MTDTIHKSEEQWKQELTPEQYRILREKGTEAPYSGALLHQSQRGEYTCAGCGNRLFSSATKYDSQAPGLLGWPSFSEVVSSDAVELREDNSLGMRRTEVICKRCGGHLGHLFADETAPNGEHYCINSVCLNFQKKNASDE